MSFSKNKLPLITMLSLLILLTPVFAHANVIHNTLYSLINQFLGFFVGISGYFLNWSIQDTIIDFGINFNSSGVGAAVNSTWVIIRDLFNLTFIFGLVYIGFKMILNSEDSNTRRWLVNLIMAALLVNFSLFITKFVIDFTNILATQIVVSGFASAGVSGTGDVDIAGTFMNNFGLASLFKIESIPTNSEPWAYIFGTAIVLIVSMFVFAAGAFLLFIRYVALLLYMIFSPLMFIGWVFPQLQGTSSKYWQGFLSRAFFAPIYVLLLYVSALIIFASRNGNPDYANMFSGESGAINATFASTFPPFIIGCMFLIASVVVASKLGIEGAGATMQAGQKFRGFVQRQVVSAPRSLVNTGGTYAEKKFNKLQSLSDGRGGWRDKVGKVTRTNFMDQTFGAGFRSAANAQLGTGRTNKSQEEHKKKTQIRANQTAAEEARENKLEAANTVLANTSASATSLSTALTDLSKIVKEMTKEEKANLSYTQLTDRNLALHLNDNDISDLEKSGNFSNQQINDIKTARRDAHVSVATSGSTLTNMSPSKPGGDNVVTGYSHASAVITPASTGAGGVIPAGGIDNRTSLVGGRSASDVGKMPIEIFKEPAMYSAITPSMLEERIKNGIKPSDIAAIKAAIETHVGVTAGTPISSWPSNTNTNKWISWASSRPVYASNIF